MSKHTPGPWKVSSSGNDIENAYGAGVCALYADESSEANARLIAAAPELLEALERLVAANADLNERTGNGLPHPTHPAITISLDAIAKAEGGTNA